jgi:hypothetical protein
MPRWTPSPAPERVGGEGTLSAGKEDTPGPGLFILGRREVSSGGAVTEEQHGTELDQSGGSFYGWRRGWPLPCLVTRPGGEVSIETTPPVELLARLAALPESEVARRLNDGHHIFLLRVDGQPAAYGWSATGPADIGGLALSFMVPRGERYLWDFVTLPAYRGRGLYPLLLQEILRRQVGEAEWFWIGHEPHNQASRRGILKAGFRLAGGMRRLRGGELAFSGAPGVSPELTHLAARALGLKHLHRRSHETHPPTTHAAGAAARSSCSGTSQD